MEALADPFGLRLPSWGYVQCRLWPDKAGNHAAPAYRNTLFLGQEDSQHSTPSSAKKGQHPIIQQISSGNRRLGAIQFGKRAALL